MDISKSYKGGTPWVGRGRIPEGGEGVPAPTPHPILNPGVSSGENCTDASFVER